MTQADILPLGPDGLLVRFSDKLSEPANRAALAFRAALEERAVEGVSELATSLTSVLVRFRPDRVGRAALEENLTEALEGRDWQEAPLPEGRTLWHIPATFEGDYAPDLEDAANAVGVSTDDAVRAITGQSLRVLALGFAPGQPYLGFLPDDWNVARRTELTPEVPRGAVLFAVRQIIPFANPAPTGWRQIGWTAFRCYDPAADPPLPLKPGDEVRFAAVPESEIESHRDKPHGGAEPEALS